MFTCVGSEVEEVAGAVVPAPRGAAGLACLLQLRDLLHQLQAAEDVGNVVQPPHLAFHLFFIKKKAKTSKTIFY